LLRGSAITVAVAGVTLTDVIVFCGLELEFPPPQADKRPMDENRSKEAK
jgi:hypothetical protein